MINIDKRSYFDGRQIVQDVTWTFTALTSTQVSVERLLLGLHFIKSDSRASIKENLTDINSFSEAKLKTIFVCREHKFSLRC